MEWMNRGDAVSVALRRAVGRGATIRGLGSSDGGIGMRGEMKQISVLPVWDTTRLRRVKRAAGKHHFGYRINRKTCVGPLNARLFENCGYSIKPLDPPAKGKLLWVVNEKTRIVG